MYAYFSNSIEEALNLLVLTNSQRSLPAPPTLPKYHSPDDMIMLEDESGRVQLVGNILQRTIDTSGATPSAGGWENLLVTGVIMAALGHETASGEFEVMDYCFAGMAPMMVKSIYAAEDNMNIDGNSLHCVNSCWHKADFAVTLSLVIN